MVDGLGSVCSVEEMAQFVGLARRIWLRRNVVTHGGSFTHPNRLVALTKQAMEDFRLARERWEPVLTQPTLSSCGWKAPRVGWLEVNWDAAVDDPGGRSGMGVVIRDSTGTIKAATCVMKQAGLNPAAAEALALMEAFRLCRELGFQQVMFAGDAKGIIDAVLSEEIDRGWLGHMIADLKQESRGFENCMLSYVKRENNSVAHLLARSAVKLGLNNTWRLMPPDCIVDTLLLE